MQVKMLLPGGISFSPKIYLFDVNNKNTRKWCEICSKLTKKTPEQCQCH